MGAGATAEQIELGFLDAVLGLAARAVQTLVELGAITSQAGDHEAWIGSLGAMFEPGDHAPFALPASCRVRELADEPLLGAAVLILLGQGPLSDGDLPLQRGILRQPDDVIDAPGVEALERARAAEPRVGAHDQTHTRPGLAQPARQQLDERTEHAGRVAPARAQHARQHVLAAEHVQRQVAVAVVVEVEVRPFLLSVQRHVSGVDVEHQLARCLATPGDERLQQHPVQRRGMRGRGRALQAAERGGRRQLLGPAHRRLQRQVVPQRVVVRHVLPAAAQAVDALRQQAAHAVANTGGATAISEHSRCRARQPDALVDLPQQHHPAVADDVAAIKRSLHHAAPDTPEIHHALGTLWHRPLPPLFVTFRVSIPLKRTTGSSGRPSCSRNIQASTTSLK